MILQLLVYPLGFHLLHPINYAKSSNLYVEVAQVDVFPSDWLNEQLFEFTETEAYSLGLEKLKMETKNFALNAGSAIFVFILMMVLVVIWSIFALTNNFGKSECLEK